MKTKCAVLWFRQDLRIHDNEALSDALQHANTVVPVYVFDRRVFEGRTDFGFPKTSKLRASFIIEAVEDLRNSLRQLGSDLIVRHGIPETEIFKIANEVKSSWVFCNRERTDEEVEVQDKLENLMWSIGQEVRFSRGKMLYYTQDLPFPVTHAPDGFFHFRRDVERYVTIREPLPNPDKLMPVPGDLPVGEIPDLKKLGYSNYNANADLTLKGGEKKALELLHDYIWESKGLVNHKKGQSDFSESCKTSMLSPYLSQGCLSPKKLFWNVKQFEKENNQSQGTRTFIHDLMQRDFFRLLTKKYGNLVFQYGGIGNENSDPPPVNEDLARRWTIAQTGVPIVDACMTQLNQTGYLSFKGRQVAASFLIHDLNINWLYGASYFESVLLDYDPCSNYCNWMYVAGCGLDQKDERKVNVINESRRFDPSGDYIKRWLPHLGSVPPKSIHTLFELSENELNQMSIALGTNYPKPILRIEQLV